MVRETPQTVRRAAVVRVLASVLQLAGLFLVVVGAVVEYGTAGLLAAVGVASVFVGLAMDRDS